MVCRYLSLVCECTHRHVGGARYWVSCALDQSLSQNLVLTIIWLGWLSREPQGSNCLHSPRVVSYHPQLYLYGDQTHILMLTGRKPFLLAHPWDLHSLRILICGWNEGPAGRTDWLVFILWLLFVL